MSDLDEKMQDCGMIPISVLLSGTPMDKWHIHTGVVDLESFSKWLDMKYEEMLRLKARIELSDEGEEHELYEWALSHCAVLTAIRCNFKVAISSQA
jgi:hypothetical protein